jgi:hypothetical protein
MAHPLPDTLPYLIRALELRAAAEAAQLDMEMRLLDSQDAILRSNDLVRKTDARLAASGPVAVTLAAGARQRTWALAPLLKR